MFLGDAAIIISGALGDTACVSGALNQYYKQNKKKLYLITNFPSLFIGQEYCKEIISMPLLDNCNQNNDNLFKKFKKIYSLYWQDENHLKGYSSITENYCEQLNVQKVKCPFFKIDQKELDNFNITNKPYILVSLKNRMYESEFIYEKSKYFTIKKNLEFIFNLKKHFKNHEIIDLADIKNNTLKDLILAVAKCDTFLSVDTSLQHLAANEFLQKKGVVLWNNSGNINIHGYEHNINLVNNFIHPYDNYDIIYKNLKLILQND